MERIKKLQNLKNQNLIKNLKEYSPDFTIVQERILKEATDYPKTRYHIVILALKRLIETRKEFKNLLLLVSVLDSQGIPRDLLEGTVNRVVVDDFVYQLQQHSSDPANLVFAQDSVLQLH